MKENKISIQVNKPASIVFEFTTNPKNTPAWINHIVKEEASEYPPKVGTIYRNHSAVEVWDEYHVSAFEQDKLFELTSKDGVYHVRYTYSDLGDGRSEMEYYEWMDEGELSNPFTQDVLNKLKEILEN